MLRGKTIEEIVNKWSTDLETNVKDFTSLAGEIAVWDRALIDNGNTVSVVIFRPIVVDANDCFADRCALPTRRDR